MRQQAPVYEDTAAALPERGWAITLYPDAGEAGGSYRGSSREPTEPTDWTAEADESRALEEAERRARTKLRRYCAANRLNRLGTLTYAGSGCHDERAVRRHAGRFFKNLKAGLEVERLAYVWVPEWHPSGHGLHIHFAVGRYVKRSLIEAAWGRGYVHIKLLSDLPVGSGTLAEARLSARYLSKYVGKAITEKRLAGLHRYEVGQGFQPRTYYCHADHQDEAISRASNFMGKTPSVVWRSKDREGWDGPPCCWLAWD